MKPTSTLKTLQERFQNALVEATPTVFIQSALRGKNSEAGMEIYRQAYFLRLKEALEEDFEETLKLLESSDSFKKARNDLDPFLKSFIDEFPSTFYTLNEFGASFVRYLENLDTIPEEVRKSARREWTLTETFYAADAAPRTYWISKESQAGFQIRSSFRIRDGYAFWEIDGNVFTCALMDWEKSLWTGILRAEPFETLATRFQESCSSEAVAAERLKEFMSRWTENQVLSPVSFSSAFA